MRAAGQKRLGVLSLTLAGFVLGAVAGFWAGRAILLRNAGFLLSDYALELAQHADELNAELRAIFRQVNASPLPYCSDREITKLQALTFHSRYIKDIGRTRNGRLDCSAFLGRLADPYPEGPATLAFADGTRIYTNVAVLVGSAEGDRGTVIESGGADVVLSPDSFDHWNRPHIRYKIVEVDRRTRQLAAIAGANGKIDSRLALSPETQSSSGVLYRLHCSKASATCAITAENIADTWRWSRATLTAYSIMGGLTGLSFGLVLSLLYLRTASLGNQLRRALRQNSPSLYLVYEPILDIKSRRCVGAEALVRWRDQDGLPISPDVFVRLAEEKGFIGELTAFVIRRATSELGDLLRSSSTVSVSVNVAASDMYGEPLFALLDQHVRQAGIRPGQVAIELTERSTANLDVIRGAIRRLRELGYKVHIDDFGTGFSSLSYLDQLAVNFIKVDRSFTRAIGTDAVTAPILPQILAMAESLGLGVIIEGVETEMQKEYLESTGKPMRMQGWYFGKSMSAAALAAFRTQSDALAALLEEQGRHKAQSTYAAPKGMVTFSVG